MTQRFTDFLIKQGIQSLAESMTPSKYNEYNEEEYEVAEFENSENFKQVFIQTLKNPTLHYYLRLDLLKPKRLTTANLMKLIL